jgi:MFS family permease
MNPAKPTQIRRRIVAVSMAMAFVLYLDRICLAEIVKTASFRGDLALTPAQIGRVLGAFFVAYAMFQVPAGWISDRFGARQMLTGYIVLWSVSTALTGFATSFPALLVIRLFCGAGEAGAYPTSGALLRRWIPLPARARANSLVIVGGRIGGTLAPFLTAWLVVSLGQWRRVVWLDGALGLAIAGFYWHIVRNRPAEHPACNEAEQALIGSPPPEPRQTLRELGAVLRAICASRSLWSFALFSFLMNFGWVFLITWLPSCLKGQYHVADVAGGRMVTVALGCGMFGQLAGGWLADKGVIRLGLKWGRIAVMSGAVALAGLAYLGCLGAGSAWGVVGWCSLVSFGVDMATPAIWAFAQDIGGRITGSVFGWGNMWGNLGATLIAVVAPLLVASGSTIEAGQRLVFIVCSGSLFLSAVAALGLDASRPIAHGPENAVDPAVRNI